jgi:acyl-CoA synthetase (AMP-forming)/AMP-acid ligase II
MIVRSPYPDVAIPQVPFHDLVLRKAAILGDRAALVDAATGHTLTYSDLAFRTRRFAAGLVGRGFQKGDVLAIFAPNVPEYAIAFLGVSAAGGASATINPMYTVDELQHQLVDSGAQYLLTVPALMERAMAAAQRANIKEIFVIGIAEGAISLDDMMIDAELPALSFDARTDLAAIPFSSGTTGRSKGVMLTHFSLAANICQIDPLGMIQENDRVMATLPFFHIYGMVLILGLGLYQGATLYTLQRFELELFLRTIQDKRITYAPCVPPIVLALAKHPLVDEFDLTSLRLVGTGAAPNCHQHNGKLRAALELHGLARLRHDRSQWCHSRESAHFGCGEDCFHWPTRGK